MKKLLITGGSGQIGLGLSVLSQEMGFQAILTGRSFPAELELDVKKLFPGWKYDFCALDSNTTAGLHKLSQLASDSDHWIHASEPYTSGDISDALRNAKDIYNIALNAGYKKFDLFGKKFIRVGSAPAEVAGDSIFGKKKTSKQAFPEDIALEDLNEPASAWETPYFKLKKSLAALAKEYFEKHELNIISAAPTAILGPFSRKSNDSEIWLRVAKREYPFNWALPALEYNCVSWRNAMKGIFLCIEKGLPGETYQLGGPDLMLDETMKKIMIEAEPSKPIKAYSVPGSWVSSSVSISISTIGSGLFKMAGAKRPWYLDESGTSFIALMEKRSSEKAMHLLGYDPGDQKSVDSSIAEMVEWFRITNRL